MCDDPVQQRMIKVSKMWKQGIKSSWQRSDFLISKIWKSYYVSPEYWAFYSFHSYLCQIGDILGLVHTDVR